MEIGSHVTVRKYLELFENLFIIRNFYTFDLNKKNYSFQKNEKSIFYRSFHISCFSKKIFGTNKLDYSRLIEGIIVEALIRKIKNPLKIGFYHNRKEIDVCFENFAIEIKW